MSGNLKTTDDTYVIDLVKREILIHKTDQRNKETHTETYAISDENMTSLLSFFTTEAIDDFLFLSPEELEPYRKGYREFYRVEYNIVFEKHDPVMIQGSLTCFFSNNPMEKALAWMKEEALPDIEIGI